MNNLLELVVQKQNEFVEEIKGKLLKAVDIVDVVFRYVSIFEKNGLYFGTCPFHFDNLVSLCVNREKQTFECSSCGRKGNAIDFVAAVNHCSKFDAIQKLAEMYKIDLSEDLEKYDLNIRKKKTIRYDFCVRSGNSMKRGIGSIKEVVSCAKEQGLDGIAICDDYSTMGFQDFQKECKAVGIEAFYGVTLNIDGTRAIAIAKNRNGIIAINTLISTSFDCEEYPYHTNTYEQCHRLGFGTIVMPIANNAEQVLELSKKYNYIAVSDSFADFENIDEKLYNRLIAVSDSYYCYNSDKFLYDALIGTETKEYKRIKTADELLRFFPRDIVITNPLKLSEFIQNDCYNRGFCMHIPYPIEANEFRKMVFEGAVKRYGQLSPEIEKRLNFEIDGANRSGFACVYDIFAKLCNHLESMNEPFALRGAGANSLIAYALGISNINPIKWKLPFETFLGIGADKIPDFDLNVSLTGRLIAVKKLRDLLGEENVIHAGYASTYTDNDAMRITSDYYKNTSKWNYRDFDKVQIFKLTNTISEYGVHPGGYLVKPASADFNVLTPIKYITDDDVPTCVNDFHQLHDVFLKIDILGHVDMILEEGLKLTKEDYPIPENYYEDEKLLSLFKNDEALNKKERLDLERDGLLGIPEFGSTAFSRYIIELSKPESIDDLVKVAGLSHGTNVFNGNGEQLLNSGYKLDDLLGSREDIFNLLTEKYGFDRETATQITDDVRKGRGVRAKYESMLLEHEVPKYLIDSMNKIKYMFPKGHAVAYTLMALKHAYVKIYYPQVFYTFYLNCKSSLEAKEIKKLLEKDIFELLVIADEEEETGQDRTASIIVEMAERGYKAQVEDDKIMVVEAK